MDGGRFDAIARATAGTSRRGALRLLASAALGALLGAPERGAAATCARYGAACRDDGGCCSGFCDDRRRGRCVRGGRLTGKCKCRCPKEGGPWFLPEELCKGRWCCHRWDLCCDFGCCRGDQACGKNGTCVCPPSRPTKCGTEGLCVDTTSDPRHCGGCDRACGGDARCVHGACVCGAAEGTDDVYAVCDGVCANTSTNDNHCGGCGIRCGVVTHEDPTECSRGRCEYPEMGVPG